MTITIHNISPILENIIYNLEDLEKQDHYEFCMLSDKIDELLKGTNDN